ncbi:MAG: 2-oxoacid:ferredoxin oxidoreductase subunit beta [Bdellovibrionota bacterium]
MSNQAPSASDQPQKPPQYTRKDFISNVDPRWCLGCGTYATLNAVTRTFMTAGISREKFAVISGIGCSSRLPYYSNTFGFHTLHGRAPAVAMGLKMAKPDLNVWVITGDGDGLSIGGNHFIHLVRRNPNIKLVLFNNQIYGLTKGQTSPTSPLGAKTKSTPFGSIDRPMHPLQVALGAGATFAARVPDTDNEMLYQVLSEANKHEGAAIIEVLINCVIFNDGVFLPLTEKATRPETTVKLEAGKPLLFGANLDKGIRMKDAVPEVVKVGEGGVPLSEILVHDPANPNSGYAFMLAEMAGPKLPVPFGILRKIQDHVYQPAKPKPTADGFDKVMRGSGAWMREETGQIRML